MPDWFYRTIAQRVLFRLPDATGRAIALGTLGGLGRLAWGRRAIDFLGHMRADARLGREVAAMRFPSPIGIGWRVDPERRATAALARFGVGFIEVRGDGWRRVSRHERESLVDDDEGAKAARASPAGDVEGRLLRRWTRGGREWLELPTGVTLPVVAWDDEDGAAMWSEKGVVLQVGWRMPKGGWRVPATMPAALPVQVRAWRARLPVGAVVIVAGGVAQPSDAVALVEAGADLVAIDAGLVFRGPGLAKRCNEALLLRCAEEVGAAESGTPESVSRFHRSWFWASCLGAALAVGGAVTLVLALTRVLLPYDEQFLGLTTELLRRSFPRLFAFMAHDRGTLAGTMLGLGWFYGVLAWQGIRRGVHGAKTALVASALTGFASFFAFLGFGYFDTLHAFVAAVLFQLTVQAMVGRSGGVAPAIPTIETEDANWRWAQWGQLLWVSHAVGLIVAGAVILWIGVTSVFVSEDLAFLCIDASQAQALGERVLSVVAHDRATLGGMLLAAGVATLLPALWCFRRGGAWLWTAMAAVGGPAYTAALGIHGWVGYTDWRHLAPALAGAALWAGGLWASRAYLCEARASR